MPVPAPQAPFQLQYRPTITTKFVELILTTVNTTFVDVTFPTTASAFVQEPTPACDSSLGESPCGPICCAVGQYCASLGFCAAVGSTTLTAITSTGFATTTVPSQRLTSNVGTTVPLSATASTSATTISSPSQTPSPPSSWLHLTASMALEIEASGFKSWPTGKVVVLLLLYACAGGRVRLAMGRRSRRRERGDVYLEKEK